MRRAVVQRDDDLLTPAQVDEHWKEVEAAIQADQEWISSNEIDKKDIEQLATRIFEATDSWDEGQKLSAVL